MSVSLTMDERWNSSAYDQRAVSTEVGLVDDIDWPLQELE